MVTLGQIGEHNAFGQKPLEKGSIFLGLVAPEIERHALRDAKLALFFSPLHVTNVVEEADSEIGRSKCPNQFHALPAVAIDFEPQSSPLPLAYKSSPMDWHT